MGIAGQEFPDSGRHADSVVATATAVLAGLAGLVLEKAMIQQIWREEIVKESVIYQDILQQGRQQGRQQGAQAGEATFS